MAGAFLATAFFLAGAFLAGAFLATAFFLAGAFLAVDFLATTFFLAGAFFLGAAPLAFALADLRLAIVVRFLVK